MSHRDNQEVRLYQALVLSVLMYAAETCTLLAAETRALEAFHMRCQRQILGVRWFDFIRNDEIALRTGTQQLAGAHPSGLRHFSS